MAPGYRVFPRREIPMQTPVAAQSDLDTLLTLNRDYTHHGEPFRDASRAARASLRRIGRAPAGAQGGLPSARVAGRERMVSDADLGTHDGDDPVLVEPLSRSDRRDGRASHLRTHA